MKARAVLFLLVVIAVLFCACNSTGVIQSKNDAIITREQAIHKIETISNSTGDVDIKSYQDMDKVIDGVTYYFIQVVFPNRMSAEYYVDEKEGNVFIAMGGELDTNNPLSPESISLGEGVEELGAITEIKASQTDALKDIFESIGMSAQQLEQKFGSDYGKVSVNYNGNMQAFLYSDHGFTAAFGEDGKVKCVYCSDKIDIGGIKSGMDFSQIQQKLGKTRLRQFWVETPINAAYEIEYSFNGRTVAFFSRQSDGNNSIMSIR